MKTWKIPVTWEMFGIASVEAETLEEAMKMVAEDSDHIKLPTDGEYVNASLGLASDDEEYIFKCYNR